MFSPVFSFSDFNFPDFKQRSLIHFELIDFIWDEINGYFILLQVNIQFVGIVYGLFFDFATA